MAEELSGALSDSSLEGLGESSSAGLSESSNSSSDSSGGKPPKDPHRQQLLTPDELRQIPPR